MSWVYPRINNRNKFQRLVAYLKNQALHNPSIQLTEDEKVRLWELLEEAHKLLRG